ncbi:MAG: hypothetical protein OET57_18725 [Desulfobacteraceae bacterium]|nr:hypothetical protein [Desulfobacteraceae bacterium]MDH3838786.1 hypothetical protein [Desulfobacteraceae bacterium]
MAKFDPDFAIFGTFAANILESIEIGDTAIDYVNKACVEPYDDLRGETVFEIISKICGNINKGQDLLNKLNLEGMLSFESKLNGKFVKFHVMEIFLSDTGNKLLFRKLL